MKIPIKQIILEASRLDKIAKKHINVGKPDKALHLYEKLNANFNRNFNISKENRSFDLKEPLSNMSGALGNYNNNLSNSHKGELIDLYKNNSRKIKQYGINNPEIAKKYNNSEDEKYTGATKITRSGDKIKNIPFNHGGGKYFLEDFLKNKSKGYRLENSHSTGIQVHPFPEINSRSSRSYSGYPHIAVNLYGERPAVLTGRIDGKFLTGAPVKEEAGIKSTNIEHIKNPKITELPVSQFSDTYKTQAIQHAITNNLPIDKFLNEDLPNADKEFRRQFRRRTAF